MTIQETMVDSLGYISNTFCAEMIRFYLQIIPGFIQSVFGLTAKTNNKVKYFFERKFALYLPLYNFVTQSTFFNAL
jgi:hypothetical protein